MTLFVAVLLALFAAAGPAPAAVGATAATAPSDASAPSDSDTSLARLAWLAGHWRGEDGATVTEEGWLAPAGGVMVGVHRDVTGNGKAFFEFLRIEQREGGLVYVAQPMGRPPTEFPATDVGETSVTFENPDHDFPRLLHYQRRDDVLHVRAEGKQGGRPRVLTWEWTRMP
jgi:hypothetical protein